MKQNNTIILLLISIFIFFSFKKKKADAKIIFDSPGDFEFPDTSEDEEKFYNDNDVNLDKVNEQIEEVRNRELFERENDLDIRDFVIPINIKANPVHDVVNYREYVKPIDIAANGFDLNILDIDNPKVKKQPKKYFIK